MANTSTVRTPIPTRTIILDPPNSISPDSDNDIVTEPLPVAQGKENEFSRTKYFIAGGIAGAVSRTATAPFDRMRVYLQTQVRSPSSTRIQFYKQAIRHIYNEGGLVSFYKGNGLNILKIFPESALKFLVFEYSKQWIAQNGDIDKDSIGLFGRFLSGGLAGLVSQFVIYPLDTIKTRVMSQITHAEDQSAFKKRDSVLRVVRNMYKHGKLKAFYRGLPPSLMGIIPYAGIDLTVFETLRVTYLSHMKEVSNGDGTAPDRPPIPWILCFGIIAGAAGGLSVYPLSVIRTRLQAQKTPSLPESYTSTLDVIRKTYAREGISGFYKGLGPTMLKLLPAVSISYVVYEKSKRLLEID